jgi:O-antigen/teichoic acid export membrane protein
LDKRLQGLPWETLARGSLLNFIFYGINNGILFIGSITLARYLGSADFGSYSFAFAYVYIFGVLSDIGVERILLRELSQRKQDAASLLGAGLLLRIFLSVFATIASIAVLHSFRLPHITYQITLIAAMGTVFSVFSVFKTYFQSVLKMAHFNLISTVNNLLILFVILSSTLAKWDIASIFVGYLVAQAFTLALAWSLASRFVQIRFNLDILLWKRLLRDAWMIGVVNISIAVYARIDQVMLGAMQNASEVGLYSVAMRVSEAFLLFPELISLLFFPLLSEYYRSSQTLFVKLYCTAFTVVAWVFIPLPFFVRLASGPLMPLLFGGSFADSAQALNILVWVQSVAPFFILLNQILIIENRQDIFLKVSLPSLLLAIVLNFLLIPHYGYIGASWARVGSMAFSTLGLIAFAPARKYLLAASKTIIRPCIATAVVVLYFSWPLFSEWVMLVTGGLLYLCLLALLNNARRFTGRVSEET